MNGLNGVFRFKAVSVNALSSPRVAVEGIVGKEINSTYLLKANSFAHSRGRRLKSKKSVHNCKQVRLEGRWLPRTLHESVSFSVAPTT